MLLQLQQCLNCISERLTEVCFYRYLYIIKIWKDGDITYNTKLRFIRQLIFPIETFEMWVYRRTLQIPLNAHHTNATIPEEQDFFYQKQHFKIFWTYVGRKKAEDKITGKFVFDN